MRLKPLLPNFVDDNWFYTNAFCANELDLRLYGTEEHIAEVYPRVVGNHMARAISSFSGSHSEWRIGRHGLVRLVHNKFSESRKIPKSEKIFFAWLEDHGWEAQLSPPGILAKQIFKRLDGYPLFMSDPAVLALIERMNGGSAALDGKPVSHNKITGARDVAVGEVKSRLSGGQGRSMLYDKLLEKGVFRLGLRAKCPTCQRYTWFAMDALSEMRLSLDPCG